MSIEESNLSENNLTPETFGEIAKYRKANFNEVWDIDQIQFIMLRITGGLNRVGLFFTNKVGQKFYPDIVKSYCARCSINQREAESNGAGLHKYEDMINREYLGLLPMELCFYGYKGRKAKPSWDFFLSFWSYQGFENMIGSFEIRKLECAYADYRGNPEIVLETRFLQNGEIGWKDWIREKLPSRNVDHKKWTF